jgi:hypothetical protein
VKPQAMGIGVLVRIETGPFDRPCATPEPLVASHFACRTPPSIPIALWPLSHFQSCDGQTESQFPCDVTNAYGVHKGTPATSGFACESASYHAGKDTGCEVVPTQITHKQKGRPNAQSSPTA